ncbi:MAG: hypothetical protein WCE44_09955 [Candidatus Velthaea sp.]|jgi:hypothetical protein
MTEPAPSKPQQETAEEFAERLGFESAAERGLIVGEGIITDPEVLKGLRDVAG